MEEIRSSNPPVVTGACDLNKPMVSFQVFPNSQMSWEIGIFKSPWFIIFLDCENSLSGTVCLWGREGGREREREREGERDPICD